MSQKILILDFGSQYTQLIARRVRETNVYCELHPFDVSPEFIKDFAPKGIILSGGPSSVTEDETPRAPQIVFELGVPVLGICYGMQTMAAQLGGTVENAKVREFGYAEVQTNSGTLLKDIQDRTNGDGLA
ncbi:MAG: gamma-glutamyl-gamma-aminobutyrate hydrolase family protein, partial [Nitrosomonas sp.]|nr:gamma-glutamyl-gamma-aminobutyrate hydrolase family protein [Nitrosomonas sp.]